MSIGFSKKLRGGIFECHLVATCDKVYCSCHLGTKWCGWFSTRPKARFEPLILSGHFDPLVSVVQFSPLIFRGSTGCFRPMTLSSVWTKNTQNCVYLSCFLRLFFVFSSCLCLFGFESDVHHSAALKLYIGLILQIISAVDSMFSTISSMLL